MSIYAVLTMIEGELLISAVRRGTFEGVKIEADSMNEGYIYDCLNKRFCFDTSKVNQQSLAKVKSDVAHILESNNFNGVVIY